MAGERVRITVDEPYLTALGQCLFIFAELEWNAVWCGERLANGFLGTADGKTAGAIGADLAPLVEALAFGGVRDRCIAAVSEFRRLVRVRNTIMHAQPCTAPLGEQRLTRDGALWSIEELNTAADEFATCSIELNDLFHHWLP